MADKKMTFGIGIKTTYDASGINKLKNDLTNLTKLGSNVKILGGRTSVEDISKAVTAANTLKNALNQAYNPKLGTVTFDRFNQAIKRSGTSLQELKTNLHTFGAAGDKAFLSATTSLMKMNTVARSTNTVLDKLFVTVKNTITWGLSSALWRSMTGSIQKTYYYIKDLDEALNDIRIVTGKSNEEMAQFAKNANDAAKALGTTTKNYTEGSLIYYQQGLSDEEVKTRTDITAKASLVTGQSMSQVSEELTAVWNGFKVAEEEAELSVDRMAAVAATTASDLEELSTAMSKVASAASNLGVTQDQLNAILATTISVTRQAPENVGTAYKTIFARISDIKAGLDGETTFGNYTTKMNEMGISVLDATGNLRDMGEVIEEIGHKWENMTREQQISLAQTMAGTRQYNNLVALFDNWSKYEETLKTSENAAGTLAEQHNIALDSINNRLNILKATWEDLYGNLIDNSDIKSLVDGLTDFVQILSDLTEDLGGLKNILPVVIGMFLQLAAPKIGQEIGSYINTLHGIQEEGIQVQKVISELSRTLSSLTKGSESLALDESLKRVTSEYSTLIRYSKYMTEEEKETVDEFIKQEEILGKMSIDLENNRKILAATKLPEAEKTTALGVLNRFDAGKIIKDNIDFGKQQEELAQLGSNLKSFASNYVSKSSFIYNEDWGEYNKAADEIDNLKDNLSSVAQQSNLTEEQIITLKREVSGLGLSFSDTGQLTKESKEKLQEYIQSIDKAGDAAISMSGQIGSVISTTKQLNEQFGQMKTSLDIRAVINDMSILAGTISTVMFSIQGAWNALKVFQDNSLTAGEKILRLFTSIGLLLPGLVKSFSSILKVFKDFQAARAALKVVDTTEIAAEQILLTAEERRALLTKQNVLEQEAITAQLVAQTAELKIQEALEIQRRAREKQSSIIVTGAKDKNNIKAIAKQQAIINSQQAIIDEQTAIKTNALAPMANNRVEREVIQHQLDTGISGTVSTPGSGQAPNKAGGVGLIGWAAANPVLAGTLAGIAAAIGAIVIATLTWEDRLKNITKKELDAAKEIQEENKKREEQSEKLKEVAKSYDSLNKQLNENQITEKEYRNQVIALTKDIDDQNLKLTILRGNYKGLADDMAAANIAQNNKLIKGYEEQQNQAIATMKAAGAQGTSGGQDLWKILTGGGGVRVLQDDPIKEIESMIGLGARFGSLGMSDRIYNMINSWGPDRQTISKSLDSSAQIELDEYFKENLDEYISWDNWAGGYQLKGLTSEGDDLIKFYESINKAIQDNAHLASTETIKELTTIRDNMKEAYEIEKDARDKKIELQKENLIYEFKDSDIKTAKEYYDQVALLADKAFSDGLFGESEDAYTQARIWANTALSGISDEAVLWSQNEAITETILNSITDLSKDEAEKLANELSTYTPAQLEMLMPILYTLGQNTAESYITGIKNYLDSSDISDNVVEIFEESSVQKRIASAIAIASEKGTFNNRESQKLLVGIDLDTPDFKFEDLNGGNQMLVALQKNAEMLMDETELENLRKFYNEKIEQAVEEYHTDIEELDKESKEKLQQLDKKYKNNSNVDINTNERGDVLDSSGKTIIGAGALKQLEVAYTDVDGDVNKLTESEQKLYNELLEETGLTSEQADELLRLSRHYQINEDKIKAYEEALQNVNAQEVDWADIRRQSLQQLDTYNGYLDDLQTTYKSLSTAEKEWNLNEGFSVDTVQALLKVSPQYIKALEMEGGQFKVNTELLNEMARAEAVTAVNTAEAAAQQQLLDVINTGTSEDLLNTINVMDNLAGSIEDVTSKMWANVVAAAEMKYGIGSVEAEAVKAEAALQKAFFERSRTMATQVDLTKDDKKGKSKKDEKDYRDEFDRYWEFKKAIDKVAEAIEKLDKKEKNLYGKEKISALKNKNELLKQQIGTYNDLYEEQKREQAELMATLGDKGVTFNDEGEITNYAKRTSEALAEYNKAVASYNAGTLSEEAFKIAEKAYEKFKKEIDRYDKLYYDEMKDTMEKIEDINREILANNLSAWEIEIKLKIDWQSLEREWSDFLHDIEKDFTLVYQDLGSELENILEKAMTYTTDEGTINTDLQAIKDVMTEIDKLKAGQSSTMFESISQAQEKLKELNSSLIKDSTDLKKLWEEAYNAYLEGIDQVNDKLEDQMKKYQQIDKELVHQQKLIGLLYGDKAYEMMDTLYKNQEKNQLAEISSLKTQKDFWEEKWKAAEEGSQEQLKYYELMIQAQDDLNSSVEAYIELLQKDLANAINKTLDELDKKMTNGLGLDKVKQEWDDVMSYNEGFFDENQRIFQIENFGMAIEQKMANASEKTQKALKDFQEEELTRLKNKQDLSEYDIKAAEYRLQLKEQELALEDAQNAKNSMKMTRDTNGNWTYQYVADDSDILAKQQDIMKTTQEYYDFAKQSHQEIMERWMEEQEKYKQTIAEIANDMTLTAEEREVKIREATENYERLCTRLGKQAEITSVDMAATAAKGLKLSVDSGIVSINDLSKKQKEIVKATIDSNKEDFESLYKAVEENDNNIKDDIINMLEETVPEWQTGAQKMIDAWNADDGASIKKNIEEAINQIIEYTQDYGDKLDELEETAGIDFDSITEDISNATDATEELKSIIEDLCNDNDLDSLASQVNNLENAWNGVVGSIKDAIQQIEIYLRKQGQASNFKANPNVPNGGNGNSSGGDYNNGPNKDIPTEIPEKTPNIYAKVAKWTIKPNGDIGFVDSQGNILISMPRNADNSSRAMYEKNIERKLPFYQTYNTMSDVPVDIKKQILFALGSGLDWIGYLNNYANKFDTGGYTGSWLGGDGRLAMLHSKELVLNAADTSNFLSAISMIREIASFGTSLENSIAYGLSSFMSRFSDSAYGISSQNNNNSKTINFNINAPITSTSTTDEIQRAILNLPNMASQYVSRSV